MNRRITGLTMIAITGLVAAVPGRADAQVSVAVQIYWEWGDGGWRSYEPAYEYVPAREVVYVTPARTVRVPPGHLPPPGYCRVWYPELPHGHQPPPEPCGRLFAAHAYAGAVILGAPAYREVYGVYDRGHGGKKGKKGNKKGKKRGRGW